MKALRRIRAGYQSVGSASLLLIFRKAMWGQSTSASLSIGKGELTRGAETVI